MAWLCNNGRTCPQLDTTPALLEQPSGRRHALRSSEFVDKHAGPLVVSEKRRRSGIYHEL